jgi:hypothetical protein
MAALLLTQIELPALYRQMLALERGPAAAVLVRNITLVTAALVAVDTLWLLPPSAQETEPADGRRRTSERPQAGRARSEPGGRQQRWAAVVDPGAVRVSGPRPIAYHGRSLATARPALRRRAAAPFARPR